MLLKSFIFDPALLAGIETRFKIGYAGHAIIFGPYQFTELSSISNLDVSFCSKSSWNAEFDDVNCILFVKALPENVGEYTCVSWVLTDTPRDLYAFLMRNAGSYHETVMQATFSTWGAIDSSSFIDSSAIIHPTAVIHENVIIGKNVEVGAGTVVGNPGFGFGRCQDEYARIQHSGGVIISDNVSIGAKCTVVSGTFQPTRIGSATIVDDHVHIAHNCQIGRRCTLTAGAILSGSVELLDDTWLGPNCSIINGVSIGPGAFVGIGSVVTKQFGNCILAGNPAKKLRSN